MIRYFQNRFTLSDKGAKDLRRGIVFSTLLNLALMLPPTYLFLFLMEYLEVGTDQHTLWFYILLAVVLMGMMFFIARWQYDSTYTTIYNESAQRRISLAEKLRRLPLAFFGERNLSDLTSTIMEDCTSLEQIFSHAVPQLFASVLSMFIIAVSLFFYDWRLAVALFWVVPMALATLLLARHLLDKAFVHLYHVKRGVTEQVQEGLECVQEIKSYCGEKAYNQSFDKRLKDYEKELVNHELVAGVFVNLSAMILKLGMPTVIITGAWLLQRGEVSIFIYLAFLLVSAMVYNPIQDVCNNLAILAFLDVRINRMKEMEAMPEQEGSKEVKMDNYDIEFRNVSFAYETEKQVLHNVSFTAKQGEVTALVGPSGGGKSTTAKLAARFWDIDGGKILLGGNDIAHIDPETLLRNYAVVFQDVLLFNASVSDNIRIGKRDATDEEVRRVAQLAQCDDFISRMPQGYDTVIGENGETLSGGERQRISIARALLKDAPVILLDEATASLDAENETKIQAGISELVQGKTVIIIAHRMRTVRNANHIVVLGGGTVIEQGTPEDLMAKGGEFARMVKLQQENNNEK
ncbi:MULTISPECIES: ABC transporter ATP-binding protein [Prevotella]|uniref:Lipid A export ATP-binding/permease protein MsbA n=2 Tax=Prevotella TaxID=838 RepID=A0A379E295_9BACT|nr:MULTISPECIES: ABC transporter ATP-binding protein [Prevotella]RQE01160.1 ABC transporter ATP-binding protein [Prevotella intermedia]RRF86518.1 ABC transporter ATP-binding protein [Prevotella intermedia]SUB86843.1 Lipid A export ATP-binding/permease protein MsbA [Prevotella denticola]